MPRGDRTGPAGMGPLTGRGAGFCVGAGVPGYMNPGFGPAAGYGFGGGRGFGRGMGGGMGGGRGWRHMYYATGVPGWARGRQYVPVPPEAFEESFDARQETAYLKAQAKQYRRSLEEIEQRLDELEKQQREEAK